jgi:uncharacterized repeat protein (TIGR03803 family)
MPYRPARLGNGLFPSGSCQILVLLGTLLGALSTAPLQSQTYEVLHSFEEPPPANPAAGLIADSAGNLYGTTQQGGAYGYGTVFKLDASKGFALEILHRFSGFDSGFPLGALIADSEGNLYGTTSGVDDYGTVFKLDKSKGYALTILHAFTGGSDGGDPVAGLIADSAGNLYGTTQLGGDSAVSPGGGTVFKLDISRHYALTTLHSFPFPPTSEGFQPIASLVADSSGNLYGTTVAGGASNLGAIFRLDASSSYAFTILHSFTGSPEGSEPHAGLIADSAGNLYGTTFGGGTTGYGTVFKVEASSGYTLKTLYNFRGGGDGWWVVAPLTVDSAGNLYGTTSRSGFSPDATVFKLDASKGYALTTLQILPAPDGGNSIFSDRLAGAALITDPAGNLYGTTYFGGPERYYGTVFKLDASNRYSLTTLHGFAYSDGVYPGAGLAADSAGNLYGTTTNGGPLDCGTVFKLDASKGHALTTLHSFTCAADSFLPSSAPLLDSARNVYGTTNGRNGTVFKLDSSTNYELTTLHVFSGLDGKIPQGALISDSRGNLYGTTAFSDILGCTHGCGTVFKLDSSNGYALTTLHAFNYFDGESPAAALLIDTAGSLYGTTQRGGLSANGTVFKLDSSNGYALNTLHHFNILNHEGSLPGAPLIADSTGNLYGTTEAGGRPGCIYGCGTIFRLDVSSGYALTILHSFLPPFTGVPVEGALPTAGLTADSAGNLYGTTRSGGAAGCTDGCGTVFKLDASKGYALTTLHVFDYGGGVIPVSSLIADSKGNLYGTTRYGGENGTGVVFRVCLSDPGSCSRHPRVVSPRR